MAYTLIASTVVTAARVAALPSPVSTSTPVSRKGPPAGNGSSAPHEVNKAASSSTAPIVPLWAFLFFIGLYSFCFISLLFSGCASHIFFRHIAERRHGDTRQNQFVGGGEVILVVISRL